MAERGDRHRRLVSIPVEVREDTLVSSSPRTCFRLFDPRNYDIITELIHRRSKSAFRVIRCILETE
jgi:hypothetical protein